MPDTLLTDVSLVPPAPYRTDLSTGAEETITVAAQAQADTDYVPVNYLGWFNRIRLLPPYLDDVSRDFPGVYRRIYDSDPQAHSLVSILIEAALSKDLDVTMPEGVPDADRDFAGEVADFCKAQTRFMPRPFKAVQYEMAEGALVEGHKLAELNFDWVEAIPGRGLQRVVADVKTKPNDASAFAVDQFNNWLGQVPIGQGNLMPLMLVGAFDADMEERILPRDKFWNVPNHPRNNDPRGWSLLRSIYHTWWMKTQTDPELLAHIATFGTPAIYARLNKDAKSSLVDASGNPLPKPLDPVSATNAALKGLRNRAVGTFVGTDEVGQLNAAGEGRIFFSALEVFDQQMAKGVLRVTLPTEQARFGTRSQGNIQQDLFTFPIEDLRTLLASTWRYGPLAYLVRYNYGERGLRYLPDVSMGGVDQQDTGKLMAGYSALGAVGQVMYDQLPGMYRNVDMPPSPWLEEQIEAGLLTGPVIPKGPSPNQPQNADTKMGDGVQPGGGI